MNQKAKFQVCKYEKGLFAFPTLANCELFQQWNNRCGKLFQIVLRLSYVYVGIRSAAGCLRVVLGFLKKIDIFCFLSYLRQTLQGKRGRGVEPRNILLERFLGVPQTLGHCRFHKATFFFPLLMSAEIPIYVVQY